MWSWLRQLTSAPVDGLNHRDLSERSGQIAHGGDGLHVAGNGDEHDAGPLGESRQRLGSAEHVDQRGAQGGPGREARRYRAVLVSQQDDAPVFQGVVRHDLREPFRRASRRRGGCAAPMPAGKRGRRCRRRRRPSFRRGCSWRGSRPCCPAPARNNDHHCGNNDPQPRFGVDGSADRSGGASGRAIPGIASARSGRYGRERTRHPSPFRIPYAPFGRRAASTRINVI